MNDGVITKTTKAVVKPVVKSVQKPVTKKEEVKVEVCAWINRGLKSTPYWYMASCNGRIVNIKKQMKRRGTFMERCPFCYKPIDWRKRK